MGDISVRQNVEVNVESPKVGTAESVELLRQLEAAAENNILHRIIVRNNAVEAIAVYYTKSGMHDYVMLALKFMVNGKEYTIKEKIDMYDWRQSEREFSYMHGRDRLANVLYGYMSKVIAKELMNQSPSLI